MIEIRFHGRGGQGTVVASILMSKAFYRAGWQVQSFPFFGVERRGAPVEAYLRLDEKPILLRTNVYTPDHVLVQDSTLLHSIDVTRGLKPGGWILLNSPGTPENVERYAGFRLAWIDAGRLAARHGLGTRTHPIVNTTMIGAFARVLEIPPMEAIEEAISEEVFIKTGKNIESARDAYREVHKVGLIQKAGTG
ncbi:MAG TPA: 2-oxoacid:acceptor oxidoreductase family protein [Syntrophales bacterium]|nr:2-oxoacid:acceptor oxidoreductase family protein [Syntrophales bacterium]HPX11735.1 2-oxoacid:acceptor oxidoreductase family protein [Syntrophales bacterium]HQB30610.1 2-oxoacid:acceptor oxidoreductase family protein [Syntrophales bacterium]HQN78227.1 2-oxoacid:acceptor oxidoreductase family protein [Syntrophales bacterium]HQQ27486.1 2-oxoacid:acceptor oxidoreductase family protein [Syntrophales bacterium]